MRIFQWNDRLASRYARPVVILFVSGWYSHLPIETLVARLYCSGIAIKSSHRIDAFQCIFAHILADA